MHGFIRPSTINDISSTSISIALASIANLTVTSINANIGNITALNSQDSSIANLTVTSLTGNNSRFDHIQTNAIDSNAITSTLGHITTFDSQDSSIANLSVTSIIGDFAKFDSLTTNKITYVSLTSVEITTTGSLNIAGSLAVTGSNANTFIFQLSNSSSALIFNIENPTGNVSSTGNWVLNGSLSPTTLNSSIGTLSNLTVTSITGSNAKFDNIISNAININAITSVSANLQSLSSTVIVFSDSTQLISTKKLTETIIDSSYNVNRQVNFLSGSVTAILPSPVNNAGLEYTFKTISACNVTISASVGLIDYNKTLTITTPLIAFSVISDNSNWYIL